MPQSTTNQSLLADTQKVKIDLEKNNTSSVMALNTELLRKTLNEDTIGVIVSYLIDKRPIEDIKCSTELLYHSILTNTVEREYDFVVGKTYMFPLFRYVYSTGNVISIVFQVEKITNCYIWVRQIIRDIGDKRLTMVFQPTKKLLKRNPNNGRPYFEIKRRNTEERYTGMSFQADISADNCYSFDKLIHFKYFLNFPIKNKLKEGENQDELYKVFGTRFKNRFIVATYYDLIKFQEYAGNDELILCSWS